MKRTSLPLLALAGLAGCGPGPFPAPTTAGLDVPDDFQIAWSSRYNNFFDGKGMVLFASIGVYDQDSNEIARQGMPLENIAVRVSSGYQGVYIVPSEAILRVDPPTAPEDWDENFEEYCYTDGTFDPSLNEWCAWYADSLTGDYYQVSGEYADAGSYAPNVYDGATNGYGRLEVALYVDSMPGTSSGDFEAVPIFVSITAESGSFDIAPGSG